MQLMLYLVQLILGEEAALTFCTFCFLDLMVDILDVSLERFCGLEATLTGVAFILAALHVELAAV